ncbi:mechanosensitive ion channel family protein [Halorarius halobius]|uniref:mechanosensitive ion channel family protein n=1 Tax=Halorarius halobius TaxID=2962671 RepID=UPI0020CC59EB|nr:mechanosensitive ion channel family protein [Halorarius halobius]
MSIQPPQLPPWGLQIDEIVALFEGQQTSTLRAMFVFVVALVVVYVLARLVLVRYGTKLLTERHVDPSIVSLASLAGQIVSAALAFGVAFAVAGFGSVLTALSAVSGAIVIALGLAANDLIANLLAGLYIINERLFEVGDWIEWDDKRGRVEQISLRVTRVRTFDNELVAVPNTELANTAITNPVAFGRLRISVQFDVGYGDVDRATAIIKEEAAAFEEVLSSPSPSVRITELGDTYVGLKARIWMGRPSRSDFNRLRTRYIRNVLRRFERDGITQDPNPVRLTGGIDVDGRHDQRRRTPT